MVDNDVVDGRAPPTHEADLRASVDELVERLAARAAGLTDAAAHGKPGAYLLPREVEGRRSRRQPAALPPLAVGECFAEFGAVFGLSQLELDVLLVAAAPDIDERIEVLYGYANDDLTRRRATPGLVSTLCGVGLDDARLHRALGGDGPLLVGGLLVVDDAALPLPSRTLRCPDRVVRWLVGIQEASPPLARLVVHPPPTANEEAERIGMAMSAGATLHFLRSPPGSDPRGVAVAAGAFVGAGTLVVDLERLTSRDDLDDIVTSAVREAQLRRAILVAGPIERIFDGGGSIERWVESRWPTVLYGNRSWDPKWSRHPPLLRTAPPVRASAQLALWKELLGGQAPSDEELTQVVASFRLTGEQVMLATGAALAEAAAEGRPVTAHDVRRTARGRNTSSLERLARRIRPMATWTDLVLPALTLAQLREFVDRAQHRELVHETWGFRGSGHQGDGLSALFAGPSGTGKTLAAEVVANALGLELYVVDLSCVVDKFIGETEKNLERIFDEAEQVNGVLVFDEADALFGKRSEVKDSHDRYANLETAFLLQRMEAFTGTAILTSNLRSNLDDAFARRLGSIISFPMPGAEARLQLWRRFLGDKVPVSDLVDLGFCAERFELSGANIRNVAMAAAFFAAADGPPIQMEDIVLGLEREYEKLGRLRTKEDFEPYDDLLSHAQDSG